MVDHDPAKQPAPYEPGQQTGINQPACAFVYISMMKRSAIFFTVVLFACACSKSNPTPIDTPRVTGAKTYLALGDSYTIGQSVAAAERFPAQTAAALRAQGVSVSDPDYIAQTGWTTGNLINAINTQNPAPNYDIVSLLIGVNDQYQGMDTSGYAIRFAQLLEKSIQLAGGNKTRVFVLSIPDYSVTPYVPASNKPKVRAEIDNFNKVNKRITIERGVTYLDITPSSREAENDPSLVANDGLHFSGLEYKKWAAMLVPKIKSVL